MYVAEMLSPSETLLNQKWVKEINDPGCRLCLFKQYGQSKIITLPILHGPQSHLESRPITGDLVALYRICVLGNSGFPSPHGQTCSKVSGSLLPISEAPPSRWSPLITALWETLLS